MDRLIAELAGRSDVLAARDWLERHDERTLALQCEIAAIPAPTGAEGERGRFLAQRMREASLADVPTSRGIPGIALGAGGRGRDAHLPNEWYENADGPAGLFRALLVALAATEITTRSG